MKEIIRILMDRDNMTKDEATEFFRETMRDVMASISAGDYEGGEDIFCSDFGLEPDYLINLFG